MATSALPLESDAFSNDLKDFQNTVETISKAKSNNNSEKLNGSSVLSSLLSARSMISRLPLVEAHTILFRACLELMHAGSVEVAARSKDVVLALLSSTHEKLREGVIIPSQSFVWNTIKKLLESPATKYNKLLGYSLWLRWIFAVNGPRFSQFITEEYWRLILQGLRHGDSEQRKLCLNILKLSVAADSTIVSTEVREQYDRYCTIFETVVLSRYINQIQECESELDFLAQSSSVEPKWLYVLLASALDSHMQDSNRKFIGNWVMRSSLEATSGFIRFFLDDFLPWAMQGQLFVSTLKRKHGELRCVHGDRLSHFVKRLQHDCSEPDEITDALMQMLMRKKSAFAYAVVYLLHGIAETLQHNQVRQLSELTNLPEVARDFVQLQVCHKLGSKDRGQLVSRRANLEQQALLRCNSFDPEVDSLEKVWDELEYLEFPKTLLMVIPRTILHPSVVRKAGDDLTLQIYLAEKVQALLKISETKTFLFPPLMLAIRETALTTPGALNILKLHEVIVRVAEHPPEPTIDLMLEEATINLAHFYHEQYFGKRPSYGFALLLDTMSRLTDNQDAVAQVFKHVLERWRNQKVPPLTVSPWKTTLQLQVLLLCLEQLIPDSSSHVQDILNDLFQILAIEPLPRYRYLLEWMIVRLVVRHDLYEIILKRLATKDHHANPKHLASLMKIGAILACEDGATEAFAVRLSTAFVPLSSSSKIVIRHEAQWQIPALLDHARSKAWTSITENPAFTALDDYIRSLERFNDPPLERRIGRFDPRTDHTMTNLVEGLWYNLDHTEAPLTSRADFVELYAADASLALPETCILLGDAIHRPHPEEDTTVEGAATAPTIGPRRAEDGTALQTKGAAYLTRTLSDLSVQPSRSNDLIVVASLVENPHNLGGLSRVSEIFGASALCLQNQNVVSNKDFTNVSVSSHLHFPIVQLSAAGIPGYLAERKSEGFTIVGIEQTDRSVVLGSKDAVLPSRVVLVVGSEREGIPAIVLTECDILVEIPQQGITRSLNVQTAVSIVLYEHARQHAERK